MLVLIKQNRVMTQNHQPILIVDLCVLLDALPIRAELSFHAVVVSLNQVLMTVELLDDSNTVFFVFPERIPTNEDIKSLPDYSENDKLAYNITLGYPLQDVYKRQA